MSEKYNVEAHVNEEPRSDLMDVGFGFGALFALYLVVFTVFVLIAR